MFERKLYVTEIMDCFLGEIITLMMKDSMKKERCMDTLAQLRNYCNVDLSGILFHIAKGSQYTRYKRCFSKVAKMGLRQSLCGLSYCFDNVRTESFLRR